MSDEEIIIRSPFYDIIVPQNVTLPEFLFSKFTKYGNKTALICSTSGNQLTFAQLVKNTKQIADSMQRLGIRENEVVAICMQSCIEYLPLVLAVSSLNAVCATSNPAYTVDELKYQFTLSRVNYVIIDDDNREKMLMVSKKYSGIKRIFVTAWQDGVVKLAPLQNFRANSRNVQYDKLENPQVRFLFSSSGTTGPPKAVMLTEQNLLAFLCAYSPNSSRDGTMKMFSYIKSDILLSVFPHFHIGGLCMTIMSALKEGATSVVLPKYQTKEFLHCIEKYKPTILIAPPPVYVFLTKSPVTQNLHVTNLRHAFIAGAPVGKELSEAMCKKFSLDYIIEAYGLTELSSFSHIVPISLKSKTRFGSCGVVVANGLCKIVDINNGRSLGPRERGEICFKSLQVMPGYLNNEKATNETIDSQKWLHTGDIGYYDEENYFYIVDRLKELIKVKGYQVAPAELEDVLMSHPAVTDAAVVGIIDEYAGELPRAYIVRNPTIQVTEKEIQSYVAEKVVSYKRLDAGVKFVEEIPKGPSGKILRRFLRDQARSETKFPSKL